MRLVKGCWLPDTDTYFEPFLCRDGGFQLERLRQSLALVRARGPHRVAVDVGAHVGMWTMELAREFPLVHCFEPAPETFACLVQNTQRYGDKVVLHNAALGSSVGVGHMMEDETRKGNTGSHWVNLLTGDVPIFPLDRYELQNVDFLKIDVEGAEALVLKGAKETIFKWRPVIYIENKAGFAKRYGLAENAALLILQEWGAKEVLRFKSDYVFTF